MEGLNTTELDEKVKLLNEHKEEWNAVSLSERIKILSELKKNIYDNRQEWLRIVSEHKRFPDEAEENASAIFPCIRFCRLLINTLTPAAKAEQSNQPITFAPPPKIRQDDDGQYIVTVLPAGIEESLLFNGMNCEVYIQSNHSPTQGSDLLKSRKEGNIQISLVLGAGNQNSIPFLDVLHKLFYENQVVLLKHNEVNDYLFPLFDIIFAPLIKRNFFHHVKGGAAVGSYLTKKSEINNLHMTGSDRTYNMIVWGNADPSQVDEPVLNKEFTSELGCVSPWMVLPAEWTSSDIDVQARLLAGAVANNNSFNCVAPKVVIVDKNWKQRDVFFEKVKEYLVKTPPRYCYYTGSEAKYKKFLEMYPQAEKWGPMEEGKVPWTIIRDIPCAEKEYFMCNEAFCPLFSELVIETNSIAEFVDKALDITNNKMWGNLSCSVIVHPSVQTKHGKEVKRLIKGLKYGTVAVNAWAGPVFAFGSPPWGAYPGNTSKDIQSGTGIVHNSFLLDFPEKTVYTQSFRLLMDAKVPYDLTHKRAKQITDSLINCEYSGNFKHVLRYMWDELWG